MAGSSATGNPSSAASTFGASPRKASAVSTRSPNNTEIRILRRMAEHSTYHRDGDRRPEHDTDLERAVMQQHFFWIAPLTLLMNQVEVAEQPIDGKGDGHH